MIKVVCPGWFLTWSVAVTETKRAVVGFIRTSLVPLGERPSSTREFCNKRTPSLVFLGDVLSISQGFCSKCWYWLALVDSRCVCVRARAPIIYY
jgi:hypothetical protein